LIFDLENPRNIALLAICMIFLTLGVLLTLSIAMHNMVRGETTETAAAILYLNETNSTITATGHTHNGGTESVIINYSDPNIITLIHDNDTDNP
jgi:hypothetical protein